MCPHEHYERAGPNSLSAGVQVQGPLKGPGSSRVVLMLSRAIWALFLSKMILKNSWSNFRGGRAPVAPPWIRHWNYIRCCHYYKVINVANTVRFQLFSLKSTSFVHEKDQWHRFTQESGRGANQWTTGIWVQFCLSGGGDGLHTPRRRTKTNL